MPRVFSLDEITMDLNKSVYMSLLHGDNNMAHIKYSCVNEMKKKILKQYLNVY